MELVRAGAGSDFDLLIGATAEEADMMFVPTRMDRLLPRFVLRRILSNSMPRGNDLLNAYGATERGGRRAGEAFTRALTDVGFRWPARQFAEAHQGNTHVFEFDWRSTLFGGRLGACHGLDLPFVFNTLATTTRPAGITGLDPPQDLGS